MILLLDAHTVLWWLFDDRNLRASARAAIADPATDVLVSASTIWEIAIKRALGKLVAPAGLATSLAHEFEILPISGADAQAAGELPPHHRDPFDRMLVAQAQRLAALIVTRDAAFAAYGVQTLTA
jgi:PIN domain nuclease of toxin-antitoxin system